MEWTLSLVKPDGVRRGLVGEVIKRYENKGLRLVGMHWCWPTRELLEEHYGAEKDQPYYDQMIDYLASGPIVASVWEGENAVEAGRQLIGYPDPIASPPGTIRADYATEFPEVVVHGSRSLPDAEREIRIWFMDQDIPGRYLHDDILGVEQFDLPNGEKHEVPEETTPGVGGA